MRQLAACAPLHVGTALDGRSWGYVVRTTRMSAGQFVGDRVVAQRNGYPSCGAAECAGLEAGNSFARNASRLDGCGGAETPEVLLVDEFVLPVDCAQGASRRGTRRGRSLQRC